MDITVTRRLQLKATNQDDSLLNVFFNDFLLYRTNIFEPTFIIVPNSSIANWLRDELTHKFGIVANVKFKLLNQFIEEVYCDNTYDLLELSTLKYLIYDFILNCDLNKKPFGQLKNTLLDINGRMQLYRAYQLAFEFERIFIDYIRFRTQELVYGDFFNQITPLQQEILRHIITQSNTNNKKTYLDVYSFFTQNQNNLNLPKQIYLFGVLDISCANLDIIKKISEQSQIKWYQVVPTLKHYYDLLDEHTRKKLATKILKEPEISIEDLHLTDGNQLIANLGIKYREFNELLIANDIDCDDELNYGLSALNNEITNPQTIPDNLLNIIKQDIQHLSNRIDMNNRLNGQDNNYTDPINTIDNDDSVQINICHNKLREIQVLFNTISTLLIKYPHLTVNDIIVYAPQINDYQNYIDAVFNNEYIINTKNKIPYFICGRSYNKQTEIIKTLINCLNLSYKFKVNDIFALINQSKLMANLEINQIDIDTIEIWLNDNNVHFGISETDYNDYGTNCDALFSFKQLINNLILGVSLLKEHDAFIFNAYDNVEFANISLINKLLKLFTFLEELRECFYINELNYQNVNLSEIINLFNNFINNIIIIDEDKLILNQFIGTLNQLPIDSTINLPILINLINDYLTGFRTTYNNTGKLTFANCGMARHVPFKAVYLIGMNEGEYPRIEEKNYLNILSKHRAFADINTTLEDKQIFLDMILQAQEFLYISYIGRRDTDNKSLNPSVSLELFLDIIKNMFIDPQNINQYITEHPLHCITHHNTYSKQMRGISNLNFGIGLGFWNKIKTTSKFTNSHWNFKHTSNLPQNTNSDPITIKLKDLVNFYSYTNSGFYNTLGINEYKKQLELKDNEEFNLFGKNALRNITNELEQLFNKYDNSINTLKMHQKQIYTTLYNRGLLGLGQVSKNQFEYIFNEYLDYKNFAIGTKYKLKYTHPILNITINNEIVINDCNQIIILNNFFNYLNPPSTLELYYTKKINSIIIMLLAQANAKDNPPEIIIKNWKDNNKPTWLVKLNEPIDIDMVLYEVLEFYRFGLTNPTLINEELINSHKSKELENIVSYLNQKNINKINQDRVFNNNYQEFLQNTDIKQNSVLFIANLLSYFTFDKI